MAGTQPKRDYYLTSETSRSETRRDKARRVAWESGDVCYFFSGRIMPASAMHCHLPSRSIQVSTQP